MLNAHITAFQSGNAQILACDYADDAVFIMPATITRGRTNIQAAFASFFTLVFVARGQVAISFGLAIGAAIGLFSLGTLIVAIPRLAKPGNYWVKFLLGFIWLIKLPVYAVTLNFAMTSWMVEPFAFPGLSGDRCKL